MGQLPHRDADPGSDTWVGLPGAWPPEDVDREAGRLSLVVHVDGGLPGEGAPLQGVFVDEWVEPVPNVEETSGLTFEYDAPGAQPPQSLLLAVPPTDEGWSIDVLADVVTETLDWAKLRTVDPEALDGQDVGHLLPALCFASSSLIDPSRLWPPDTPSIELADLVPPDLIADSDID